jgi:hypothetical protein
MKKLSALFLLLALSVSAFDEKDRTHTGFSFSDEVNFSDFGVKVNTILIGGGILKMMHQGGDPLNGNKLLVTHKSKDGVPRCRLDGLPKQYRINITTLGTAKYDQTAWQFGHEAAHVWIGPYRHGWFVESVCMAVGIKSLDFVGNKWVKDKNKYRKSYAANFFRYKQIAYQHYELPKRGTRIEAACKAIEESKKTKKMSRNDQVLVGYVIYEMFKEYPELLDLLDELGTATTDKRVSNVENTDMNKWENLAGNVSPKHKAAVVALRNRLKL